MVGEVGSGKSTLIEGILGELPVSFGPPDNGGSSSGGGREDMQINKNGGRASERVAASLHRGTRVCYSAQTPWVMTGTLRDNVLFGLPMEEGRYRCVSDGLIEKSDICHVYVGACVLSQVECRWVTSLINVASPLS